MGAIIADFGKNERGINIFRINGTKEEINKAIEDIKKLGAEVWGEPFLFEKAHKHWSVLVRIQLPEFSMMNIKTIEGTIDYIETLIMQRNLSGEEILNDWGCFSKWNVREGLGCKEKEKDINENI